MTFPGENFVEAVAFASRSHDGQYRKGTTIPYISHPMAVASLVLEFGGNENEAIAGLLHDVLEDGGIELADDIERLFGSAVVAMVRECSDAEIARGEEKPPWQARKVAYIASLKHKSSGALLVTACDKLHNLSAITRDYREHGESLWDRFNASAEEILWYYRELVTRLTELDVAPAAELKRQLGELESEKASPDQHG